MTTKKKSLNRQSHRDSNRRWFQRYHQAFTDWRTHVAESHLRIYEYSLFGSNANRRAICQVVVSTWTRNYKINMATRFWFERLTAPMQSNAKAIAASNGKPDQWHKHMPQVPDPDWKFSRRYRERYHVGNEVPLQYRIELLVGPNANPPREIDTSDLPIEQEMEVIKLLSLIKKDTRNYENSADKTRKELQQSILHRFNFRPRRKVAMEIAQVLDCVHGTTAATYEFARNKQAMIYDWLLDYNRPDQRDEQVWLEAATTLAELEKKDGQQRLLNIQKKDREAWPYVSATILLHRRWIDESEFMDRIVQHAASIAGRKSYRKIWMPDMTTDPHAVRSMPKARAAKIGEFAAEIAGEYFERYVSRGATSWTSAVKGALRRMGRQWQGKPLITYGIADGVHSRVVKKREWSRVAAGCEEIMQHRRKEIMRHCQQNPTDEQVSAGGYYENSEGKRLYFEPLPKMYEVRETIRHLADAPYVNPNYLDSEEIGKYVNLAGLTRDEGQVFEFLQRGKTLKQIADITQKPYSTVARLAQKSSEKMSMVVSAA